MRLAFGAFNVPSEANCLSSFMELNRRKFCNNQLEYRTIGERADTMLSLSSEPHCSAGALYTNMFYYSLHSFITLYGTQLMAACFGLSFEPSKCHSGTRKCRGFKF